MRHHFVLHAAATIGLLLGSSLISVASSATADQALTVSFDDFIYVDTSNEPTDQTAAHERRLRAFMAALRDDVTADLHFRLTPSPCASKCPTDGPALRDRLRVASEAGTQVLIIGTVHKLSTLVQVARIAAVDVEKQRVLFRRYFQFRGDSDEAWQRAQRFISEEVRARLLEIRSQP
ncbi:DUF2380 domain-containing protein [Bradyrhizobium oligotrophicum S58]